MLSVLEPYNLPNTESVSLIMYPSDCNTKSPIGTAKRLPKLFLLKLPFIASLFEIFLMYFNIIEWQVKRPYNCCQRIC